MRLSSSLKEYVYLLLARSITITGSSLINKPLIIAIAISTESRRDDHVGSVSHYEGEAPGIQ